MSTAPFGFPVLAEAAVIGRQLNAIQQMSPAWVIELAGRGLKARPHHPPTDREKEAGILPEVTAMSPRGLASALGRQVELRHLYRCR